jgi:hypothetical protein
MTRAFVLEVACWTGDICVRKLLEDGTVVPKHVEVIRIMNCVVRFVIYCILLRAFVGQYSEFVVQFTSMQANL